MSYAYLVIGIVYLILALLYIARTVIKGITYYSPKTTNQTTTSSPYENIDNNSSFVQYLLVSILYALLGIVYLYVGYEHSIHDTPGVTVNASGDADLLNP